MLKARLEVSLTYHSQQFDIADRKITNDEGIVSIVQCYSILVYKNPVLYLGYKVINNNFSSIQDLRRHFFLHDTKICFLEMKYNKTTRLHITKLLFKKL